MNQRRRQSPAVYRRRRLVAALLGVVLLALLAWGGRAAFDAIFGDSPDESSTAASSTAEPSPTSESSTTNEDDDDAASGDEEDTEEDHDDAEIDVPEGFCAPSDVEVRASTSHETYNASTAPLLVMEIENVGSEECTVDVGTSQQQFVVRTNGREIFNTGQCDINGESLEMDFEPGQTERAQMLWPRSDSAVDCAEPAQLVTGNYELTVSVSGISSDPHTFEVRGTAG